MILLHYTGMPSAEGALKWLCDPRSEVSSHYFVFEDGRVLQLVDERERAWHAGRSYWAGEADINSCSVGIEIANPGHRFDYRSFPDVQIDAVIALCRDILRRNTIPPERVLAHSDVAPRRKEDPGELFPWRLLHKAGIGHWVDPEPIETGQALTIGDTGAAVTELKKRFRDYGYGLGDSEDFDLDTAEVVAAFQRHFRQGLVDGIADRSTYATLDRLIGALPKRG